MEKSIASLSQSLLCEVVDTAEPSPERAEDILMRLQKESLIDSRQATLTASDATETNAARENETSHKKAPCKTKITIAILESTNIGKALTKVIKACKRHKRTSSTLNSHEETMQWQHCLEIAQSLILIFKEAADAEVKQISISLNQKKKTEQTAELHTEGLPTSASAYKTRLIHQKKELYKDPPSMPPPHIVIDANYVSTPPKRNKKSGELAFLPGEDTSPEFLKILSDFRPNRTPEDVLRSGSFGGTYFRPICSAVTNLRYASSEVLKSTVRDEWIDGLEKGKMLASSAYRADVNKFGVKCGGSLGMWESSGWISDSDPYGWFQWYCRFFQGRRCTDDSRQISRWLKSAGPKGRFRSQLCNKIIGARTHADDARISPVIRQTLLHWGLEVTEDIVSKHKKR